MVACATAEPPPPTVCTLPPRPVVEVTVAQDGKQAVICANLEKATTAQVEALGMSGHLVVLDGEAFFCASTTLVGSSK